MKWPFLFVFKNLYRIGKNASICIVGKTYVCYQKLMFAAQTQIYVKFN